MPTVAFKNKYRQTVANKFIDLDFETRCDLDITKVGAYKYATHPSCKILMLSWTVDGKKENVQNYDCYFSIKIGLRRFINPVKTLIARGYKIRAFNAMFEYLIWVHVGIRQLNFPELQIDNFYCLQAQACVLGLPASLENASMVIGKDIKNKEGKALIKLFCNPQKDGSYVNPLDKPKEFLRFKDYCNDDVLAQISIANNSPLMTLFQYAVYVLTEKMNLRGIPIDTPMIEGALALSSLAKEESNKAIQRLTNNCVTSITQNKVLQQWLHANNCPIPNMQAATIDRWVAEKKKKLSPVCYDILCLRQTGAKSSVAKYLKVQEFLTDGAVHDFIKYHIAHTGRWGGRGIQIQNYPKPSKHFPNWADSPLICEMIAGNEGQGLQTVYGSVNECLKAVARGMLKAPKGFKFVSADYSQVEARIVFWLAGDKLGLADFSGAAKIYEKMAGDVFNIDAAFIKKPSLERDIGKEIILGCGFGMGADKFFGTCTEKRGLNIDFSLAEKGVKGYRSRYKDVPKAWKDCEKQAINACQNKGTRFFACKGLTSYFHDGVHLTATLPSGRKLWYPYAEAVQEEGKFGLRTIVSYYHWDTKKAGYKWTTTTLWGGTFFQHKVQAIAADCISVGMLNAEDHGYPTIFTVHDEAVAQVPDDPLYNYKEYETLLCAQEAWAQGIPLVAEGWEGPRYKK